MISSLFSNQQDLLQAWVWAMFHSVWIGLVLAFVFYTYLGLKPEATSKSKYRVGVFLMALLPVSIIIAFIYSIPDSSATSVVMASTATTGSASLGSHAMADQINGQPYFLSWMNQIEQHVQLIFIIWSIGVLLFSIRMAMGYHQIYRLRSQTIDIVIPRVLKQFQLLLSKSGMAKKIALVSSSRIDIPLTIGHLKPMILLPIGLINRLSPEETQAILAHEIAHIIRKDYLQNLLISSLEILFFYHPSVWWFSATVKAIREQCCDDIALQLGAERIALSKALIQLEEQTPGPAFALAFAHKNQLLNRIQRLFQNPGQKPVRNEYGMSRSQAPLLLCGIAMIWLMTNPLASMNASRDMMQLSKSFIWDRVEAPADTTKPKTKIEKISRDNGKQKIEMSLEDKKIKELKVDEKVIPPAEYEKYKLETEALQKELAEIEMPERRTRVFSDFGPGLFEYRLNDSDGGAPRVFSGRARGEWPRAYTIQPRSQFKSGDGREFYFGEGLGKGQNYSFNFGGTPRWGHHDGTKWVFEGDSSGMIIDGDQLIIKNDKGDVIIDLGGRNNGMGHSYKMLSPEGLGTHPRIYMDGIDEEQLMDEQKIRLKIQDRLVEKTRKNMNAEHRLFKDFEGNQKDLMEKIKSEDMLQKGLLDDMRIKRLSELEHLRSAAPFRQGELLRLGHKNNLQQAIEQKLDEEDLIGSNKKYEFKITSKELRINGKKQTEKMFNQFKSLVEDISGIDLDEGTMIMFSGTLESSDRK